MLEFFPVLEAEAADGGDVIVHVEEVVEEVVVISGGAYVMSKL